MAAKTRYVLVGVGNRGTTMWGRELLEGWGDTVELVAICDLNRPRAEAARKMIGSSAPIHTDLDDCLSEHRPDLVIVCTRDDTHDDIIVKALEAGADVISEKPMTTAPDKIARIRDAEKRTGRKVDVSFNYRYAPTAAKMKQMLDDGEIGTVTSVDFHWYLDNDHGADYFRRWHAFREHSGSLFVHKATHHFDLLNWYLGSDPESVLAFGELRNYGINGPFRAERCHGCPHASECRYFFDMEADPFLWPLYGAPAEDDGYYRDACVYREEIDIPDTMVASIRYANRVLVSYSLNTYMPVEGHHIAFNGTDGRIELRQFEKQPWETEAADEIKLIRSYPNEIETIEVPHAPGGHYGGDNLMRDMIFRRGNDPLHQRAGSRAGAMSVLTGLAALKSSDEGAEVSVASLLPGLHEAAE
ncbi:Predicted dehydrogenase [Tranquillimonas rosea]|uniref:Predicted dehydrogenase n=1 Tax=Tranquillimonas rosea TaxID=641238 RepID=A0A1H9WLD6_9RHOB|nr:Gfo/Idh/MocA family oxidoreductase [Tranquillimonas rosea]SES34589.1 Predicted dehydrogenase [Tranquillimonas rosea]